MAKFSDIANKKVAETVRPPLPPVGMYTMQITGPYTVRETSGPKGDFEIMSFPMGGVQGHDDVDQEELAAFGGAKNVRGKKDFIFNNGEGEEVNFLGTENQLKDFLYKHLGISEDEAPTYQEALAFATGRTCLAEIGHRPDARDPENFFTDIKKTMSLEE